MSKYTTNSLFGAEEDEGAVCSHIIRVAFESAVDKSFDYLVPDDVWPIEPGRRVEAPFGRKNKARIGYCVESDVKQDESFAGRGAKRELKKVSRVIDKKPLLNSELMELAKWLSRYYVCPLGQVLAAMLPAAVKKAAGVKTVKFIYLAISRADCDEKLEQLKGRKQKQIVSVLRERKAFGSKAAVSLKELLAEAGCTDAPVKKLAEKQIVRLLQRMFLKALPVMPERFVVKTDEKVMLNDDQKKALVHINEQINRARFGVTLLHGVTDSGKTELYIRAIETVLAKHKAAIVMLPEIALTAQTIQRFNARFERIAVMHSGLRPAARNAQWQKIKAGEADVVIGARSAVFAPLKNVGLIIVDEEHEPSYKQDTAPRYNGRDVAIKRAQLADAHCVLGTATPSLETLCNCRTRKHFNIVRLSRRVMDLPMPTMRLVDMRYEPFRQKGGNLISDALAGHLANVLGKGEQAILLLNRRGYSNFVFCPGCKHSLHCRNCDVTLTFHKANLSRHGALVGRGKHISYGYAACHYCFAQTLVPEKCPVCGKKMVMFGLGSQRLEEELCRRFSTAQVARVDSDSMRAGDYYQVLRDFSEGRIEILAGTQMLAKGLHFPNVTLVGIISADTALSLPDFRANERTFQLICQVAGRAGRSRKQGSVFIQSFLPDQPAIQFAVKYDYDSFVAEELKHRKSCNLPPYWRLALIELRDVKFDRLATACKAYRERLDYIIVRDVLDVHIRGPMAPAISRVQRYHRMQIIVQAANAETIQRLFGVLRAGEPIRPSVKVAVDIDPVNVL